MSIAYDLFSTGIALILTGITFGLGFLFFISLKNPNDATQRQASSSGSFAKFGDFFSSTSGQSEKPLKIYIYRFQRGGASDAGAKLTLHFTNLIEKSKLSRNLKIEFYDAELKHSGVDNAERAIRNSLKRHKVDLGIWGYVDSKTKKLKIRFVLAHGTPIEMSLLYQHGSTYDLPTMADPQELDSVFTSIAHLSALSAHHNFHLPPKRALQKLRAEHAELIKKTKNPKGDQSPNIRINLLHDYAFSALVAHQIWGDNDDISQSITAYRGLLAEQDQHVSRRSQNSVRHGLGEALLKRGEALSSVSDLKNAAISLNGAVEFLGVQKDDPAWIASACSLGDTLTLLGAKLGDDQALVQSESIFQDLSNRFDPKFSPENYLQMQIKLANSQQIDVSGNDAPFDALNTLRNGSNINREYISPRTVHSADQSLGDVLLRIGEIQNDVDYMQAGVKALDHALTTMPEHAVLAKKEQQAEIRRAMESIQQIRSEINAFRSEFNSQSRYANKEQEQDIDNESFVDLFNDGDAFVQDRRDGVQRRNRSNSTASDAIAKVQGLTQSIDQTGKSIDLNDDIQDMINRRRQERRKRREENAKKFAASNKSGAMNVHPQLYNPMTQIGK